MADEYEGWSNRETWCANLWLANDEGLYNLVNELADQCWDDTDADDASHGDRLSEARYRLGNLLDEQFAEWATDVVEGDPTSEELRRMLFDIGSLYRVDWHEIAQGWVNEASER